jgi:hypothetical protein
VYLGLAFSEIIPSKVYLGLAFSQIIPSEKPVTFFFVALREKKPAKKP